MGYKSILRGGLFIFECSRFAFLTVTLAVLKRGLQVDFPWLLYAVPNALFPVMLLFLWLDFSKYGVYEPLYKSGKCICLFAVAGWYFFEGGGFFSAGDTSLAFFQTHVIMLILILGDLFTLVIAAVISFKNKKCARAAAPAAGADAGETAQGGW